MELKREQKSLQDEKATIEDLLASDKQQWKTVAWEIKEVRKTFGPDTAIGKPPHDLRRNRPTPPTSISPRPWWSASRSP